MDEHSEILSHIHGKAPVCEIILTIRSHTGLSGDMFLTGLAVLRMQSLGIEPLGTDAQVWLDNLLSRIMPSLSGRVKIARLERYGIGAYCAEVDIPHEHEHRHFEDIRKIILSCGMEEKAKELAISCFEILARAEGKVHGMPFEEIGFHEVGALDSILDICAVCELYVLSNISALVIGPLPLADGVINCAHGNIIAPAPVVLELLKDFEIKPFAGANDIGELVTPTALALLRALGAKSGKWPYFQVENCALVYGQKAFPGIANGCIFALGQALSSV